MIPEHEHLTLALLNAFGDLVGGADMDEIVAEFEDIDPDSLEEMLPRLRSYVLQGCSKLDDALVGVARTYLETVLASYDATQLEQIFDFFLFPFHAPKDLRMFFGWVYGILDEHNRDNKP